MLRRFGSLLLVVIGLLLVITGLGYGWLNNAISTPSAAELPDQITGLPLTQANYGPEAVEEITRLHDQSFPLSSGAFGMYGREGNMIMLWVTGTPARFMASRMVSDMEEAIAGSESPYTPIGAQEMNGRTVYVLKGMEQQHYYFQSEATIIWLAADHTFANRALAEVLAFYP